MADTCKEIIESVKDLLAELERAIDRVREVAVRQGKMLEARDREIADLKKKVKKEK